ncbi:MAG: Tat pathway signal sequence domain protein [Alphaproteobacteria bacterium]|nr:Tat pathway signal sequence domain protein [Alphaproteobacteria bacterium]MBU0796636.1 Tat pathway signal sequence domain protein [Alphaproteobacteria bacterium]MBU0886523.1 Tat pathway signal sequence domain protein [Alphaproteobacteria bacterium]MBU1814111.1 Tat pathway signal sequence domain protein [Alphaproteobacteria bacterium]MBU2091533.1 Tat pathway signal sequence domain protein [Alphaproteobacteria bacterium]
MSMTGKSIAALGRIAGRKLLAAAFLTAGLGLGLAMAGTAQAQGAGSIAIELNKLEDQPNACRAYMLFENPGQSTFSEFQLDLVLFDTNGVIARRLSLDAAPLRADKTSVKLFDIEGLACERISRILLNDVLTCADDSGKRTDCVKLIQTSSRVTAKFSK